MAALPTSDAYRDQLISLLPRGWAWEAPTGSLLYRLLWAFAQELWRIHARMCELLEETDPRTTVEMLVDWERNFGLPEQCAKVPTTLSGRQAALIEKVTRIGGQSPAYLIQLAAAAGFTITITEHPGTHTFTVNSLPQTFEYFDMLSDVTESLREWDNNPLLECLINRVKPAQTAVTFNYPAS